MIFKIWQCSAHKEQRGQIGINRRNSNSLDRINEEGYDCPFCVIASLKQQLIELQGDIKCT